MLKCLLHDFPDTLWKYDHIMSDGCECSVPCGIRGGGWELDIAVANAARDSDAPLLLPAALLSLYSEGMDAIVDAGAVGALLPANRDCALKAIPTMWLLSRNLAFELQHKGAEGFAAQPNSVSQTELSAARI